MCDKTLELVLMVLMFTLMTYSKNIISLLSDPLPVVLLNIKKEDPLQFFDYFELVQIFNERQFKEDFRMSRRTFQLLHKKLCTSPSFTFTGRGKPPIDTEKCLCIGLWVLASPDSYRSIARRFAVSKSTVVVCLRRVVKGLLSSVCKNAVKHPRNEQQRAAVAANFSNIAGLEGVIGAIDGCHIQIKGPKKNKVCYYDRKCNYSLTLQAICDADCYFTDVDVRWPGSVHDARVFTTSDVYEIGHQICENNYYFIGDSAYPLKLWLIRPYKQIFRLSRKQKLFNKTLSSTRQVIERAFGLLKNRFRRLYYLHNMHIEESMNAIVACCVLHNLCQADGSEEKLRSLIFDQNENEQIDNEQEENIDNPLGNFNFVNATDKRIHLQNYIWNLKHN